MFTHALTFINLRDGSGDGISPILLNIFGIDLDEYQANVCGGRTLTGTTLCWII